MMWSIATWRDYFAVRGVRQPSPLPVLMQYPLSIYYALLLKQHLCPDDQVPTRKGITICYLGPEVELSILPVFWELGSLLGSFDLHIHFIGPEVQQNGTTSNLNPPSTQCNDSECICRKARGLESTPLTVELLDQEAKITLSRITPQMPENECQTSITLHTHTGFYHTCDLGEDQPSLVFASNAGIELYPSWIPTLEKLTSSRTFTVLTDYTEEAIYRSVQFLKMLGYRPSLTFLNPFCNPLSDERAGIAVPCHSNGFGLILNGGALSSI